MSISFRTIKKTDNPLIANLIKEVLREHGIARPGTVYTDPTTDHLYELFQKPNALYWIAEENNVIIGGCGLFPTEGLPEGCTELVKLYISAHVRGRGIGFSLLQKSTQSAKDMGYKQIYLESTPELTKAIDLYEKSGFKHIDKQLGNTGHFSCNVWMLKDL